MAEPAPLRGVRVLEWARYLPGPYAGLLLHDLGADVVKVEEAGVGDPTRLVPPFDGDESVLFRALNRGKRSVALDLKKRAHRAAFVALAKRSDVLLDGHRPGVAKRLGLDWPRLRRAKPRLVYCAITGYGHRSPYAKRAGHDVNYQSFAGAVGLTGRERPEIPGVQVGDILGAWSAVAHVLAALRTRKGAFLDVSMTDAVVSGLGLHYARAAGGMRLERPYDLTGDAPYYALYECADGKWLSLAALEPRFWSNLCHAVPELHVLEDMQWATGKERERVRRDLIVVFRRQSRATWLRQLTKADVPVAPVLEPREVPRDPHVRARGLFDGALFATPFAFGGHTAKPRGRAPRLGEHTEKVLREAGLTAKAAAALG